MSGSNWDRASALECQNAEMTVTHVSNFGQPRHFLGYRLLGVPLVRTTMQNCNPNKKSYNMDDNKLKLKIVFWTTPLVWWDFACNCFRFQTRDSRRNHISPKWPTSFRIASWSTCRELALLFVRIGDWRWWKIDGRTTQRPFSKVFPEMQNFRKWVLSPSGWLSYWTSGRSRGSKVASGVRPFLQGTIHLV